MEVHLLEAFYGGSHAAWANGLSEHSSHHITLVTLSDHHWKWRMKGGAISLIEQLKQLPKPNAYLCSDMMDVALFRGLLPPSYQNIPIMLYFHENQLTYPWSPTDPDAKNGRDLHYAFTNFTSALAADSIWFNSTFHRKQFICALHPFLNQLPDHKLTSCIKGIENKSIVVPVGIDLARLEQQPPLKSPDRIPKILWNHRWEYDKNASAFFEGLRFLRQHQIDFRLIVLGEERKDAPPCFAEAKQHFEKEIIHWGFVTDTADYASLLWQADIIPVTANQEFFGISLMEALYCETYPLVPNRLVYPEHLPELCFLYQEDLGPALLDLVKSGRWKHGNRMLKDRASQFNWTNIIELYDHELGRVKRKPALL